MALEWQRRAKKACESAGQIVSDHFRQAPKMIQAGKGAEREQEDMYMDRYACYLLAI